MVSESDFPSWLFAEWEQPGFPEKLLAAAVRSCVANDEIPRALALLDAKIARVRGLAKQPDHLIVELLIGAASYDRAVGDGDDLYWVFANLVPPGSHLHQIDSRVRLDDVTDDWRDQVRAGLAGEASNQGVPIGTSPIHTHHGLNYRSKTEIKIADELDSRGVLFFPNSRASRSAVTREPDFLIVHRGRVGILEVDGPTHQGLAAEDHRRDLFFQQSGIVMVKHFTAADCYNNPKLVVETFLDLLIGPGR